LWWWRLTGAKSTNEKSNVRRKKIMNVNKAQKEKTSNSFVTAGGRLILASFRTFRCSATFGRSHTLKSINRLFTKIFCASPDWQLIGLIIVGICILISALILVAGLALAFFDIHILPS
jgi:hypothetical protein